MAVPVSMKYLDAINGLLGSRIFKSTVSVYFDGESNPPVIFSENDISEISFDADGNTDANLPFGQIALKTVMFTMNNVDRQFTYTNTKSPYYGKLLAGTKVTLSINVCTDIATDTYENIDMGSFYTGDWNVSSDDIFATMTCYDRLYALYETDTPKVCVVKDTSIGELFRILLLALGIANEDIIIDTNIFNITVPYGWLPELKVKATLGALCLAGACTVLVRRDNKIYVSAAYKDRDAVRRLRNTEQVVSISQPQNFYKAYAGVTVQYSPTSVETEVQSVASNNDMLLITGENKIDSLSFSGNPVLTVTSVSITDSKMQSIFPTSIGALAIDATIVANASNTADVEVFGYKLKQSTQKITVDKIADIVPVLKDKRLTIESPLIQTEAIAKDYADILINIATDPAAYLTSSITGDPSIDLLDKVLIHPDRNATVLIPVVITRMTFTYNGGLQGTLECTKAAALEKYMWAYMGPGFYTKAMKKK